ncbi:type IVB secretion system protein IcmH/DotU [Herbaspirillum seropedicae]|uniref:Type IV / VI secretion system transmembrane protein n=1 Tax=Herbaspirillum seropedicae (strain SmR1) TaxID=757424 RepID=D8ISU6_HERSS|nr:type IVB secretion system protein IcmH/DotU [Herbaspirillum seropedicae]ADJ65512.1 type IV / VI secretion system transmembrane protein [Herbaspirillum seropedicae SmR1]
MTSPPSLLDPTPLQMPVTTGAPINARSLLDLIYDGFYALFMLKNGGTPVDDVSFESKMQKFLGEVERNAKKINASPDDIYAAKYAFCASVDEIILRSKFGIRPAWERRPLQLTMFGDQLAGENFFHKLEELRLHGNAHIQALEVFHMCLLLGFQGKYALEGPEKLNYLTARLGDEIAHLKGKSAGFAPHWERPDAVINKLRNDVPLWVVISLFALITLFAYLGVRWMLISDTENGLAGYSDIVKLAPRTANLTITLP